MKQKKLVLGLIVLVITLIGGNFLYKNRSSTPSKSTAQQNPVIADPQVQMIQNEGQIGLMVTPSYTGKPIAGTTSPYIEFTQTDYDTAISTGKTILLNFYADWCPICRAEAPGLKDGFDALKNENVIGFRVNYKDDQTDEEEKKLAQYFDITYQHTKVLIKDGKQVLKVQESWDKDTVIKQLSN